MKIVYARPWRRRCGRWSLSHADLEDEDNLKDEDYKENLEDKDKLCWTVSVENNELVCTVNKKL